MEFETFVIEPVETQAPAMDFGEAQQAYSTYPQARDEYHARKEAYLGAIETLRGREPASVTVQEMEEVDTLAVEAEYAQEKCLNIRAVLSGKRAELIAEATRLEKELAYHAPRLEGENLRDLERGLLSLEECRESEDGEILSALEKAYRVRTCLTDLLDAINSGWLQTHYARAERLRKTLSEE